MHFLLKCGHVAANNMTKMEILNQIIDIFPSTLQHIFAKTIDFKSIKQHEKSMTSYNL